jgi:hypothetical protein
MSKVERRLNQRVPARLPVSVRTHARGAEATAHTRDLSSHGVFLYTGTRMAVGSNIELVLILPPELTDGQKCWVCCHARVLRVEENPDKTFGVAAEIQKMDMLPELSP